ncbi:MAG: N-acetyltransferase family protein [Chitinophagaceae bacterium]|nr:MAG: N-acetyltransferase family protein [Chitinophagaceae bacterium]
MPDNTTIRLIETKDHKEILNIYGHYILNTSISFEYDIPSLAEFSKRIEKVISFYPWLVAELNGQVVGYAYASRHRERKAYDWSAESSVYIREDAHRQGIAKKLYTALFQLISLQGIVNVYAGITLPNAKSESFHKAMGFSPVGVYHHVGYKFKKWHDVLWMEKELYEHADHPPKLRSLKEIEKTDTFRNAFT